MIQQSHLLILAMVTCREIPKTYYTSGAQIVGLCAVLVMAPMISKLTEVGSMGFESIFQFFYPNLKIFNDSAFDC